MPANIALIKYHLANAGGLEKQTWRIARAFQKAGRQVDLLTTSSPKNCPFPVHELPCKKKPLSFQNIRAFDKACQKHLKTHSYPILFTMDRIRFATHIRAGNGCHAAYLNQRRRFDPRHKTLTFPLNPLHRTLLKLEKKAFENPLLQKLITNSAMVKSEILTHYNVPEKKIVVIHNGVEWEEMAEPFSRSAENSRYHFLFVGSGFRRKGLRLLLAALAHLSDQDWKLSVVGDDRKMTEYLALTEKLGLTKQVKFFGRRSDVIDFYRRADCLVLPTQYDPFANTTVEALAMGLTVLTSKSNGGHEILKKETGILIEDLTSKESLIAALQEALTRPKTKKRAEKIRNSVQYLTFDNQLTSLVETCLSS